jgi:hypothetical protein
MIVRQDLLDRKMKPLGEQHYALIQLLIEALENFDTLHETNHAIRKEFEECPLDQKTIRYVSYVVRDRYGNTERKLRSKLREVGGQLK